MRWFVLVAVLILTVEVSAQPAIDFDQAQWSRLLAAHVTWTKDGSASVVDYAAFSKDRDGLKAYLASTSKLPKATFDAWSKVDREAFLLNVYNAATIELILTHYPDIKSIKDLGGLFGSPWKKEVISLFGDARSLDDIEQTMLRGATDYTDPRIHFALNCASIGCPALRPEAYLGSELTAQLDDQAKRFLRDRSRNRFDPGKGISVSKIFDWYAEDFDKHAGGVRKFLAGYADLLGLDANAVSNLESGTLRISYTDYDWRLNDR